MTLSPAQVEVLRRLRDGDRLVFTYSPLKKRFWMFRDMKGVLPKTFSALRLSQALERTEYNESGSAWVISDTGRELLAALEETK